MIYLTVDEILLLHEKLLQKTGGLAGIRDMGMLESAIYGAMQVFDNEELYPTPQERAARLAFALTKNHPFLDGNKRVGILVMLMTLRLNHITIAFSQQETIALGRSIADGTIDYRQILEWIYKHEGKKQ